VPTASPFSDNSNVEPTVTQPIQTWTSFFCLILVSIVAAILGAPGLGAVLAIGGSIALGITLAESFPRLSFLRKLIPGPRPQI
jgi:hypothetical protein